MPGFMEPIEVVHVTKQYLLADGGRLTAVSDMSFAVPAGECFGLLGPNGAGKSTAIHCISGFYPTTSGTVRLLGHDVHADPRRARQALGICSQEDTLDSDFRVLDQLVRYASYFRISRTEGERRARALLERFGLGDRAADPVESLSGGMKRRLQVARALISQPKVLVLDEPTVGLDPEVRHMLWDILMDEREAGTAILLCTHYMEEAERLCDRVGIMMKGTILDIDSPAALVEQHVGNTLVNEEIRPGVIWTRKPNLEDVYLKLTGVKVRMTGDAT